MSRAFWWSVKPRLRSFWGGFRYVSDCLGFVHLCGVLSYVLFILGCLLWVLGLWFCFVDSVYKPLSWLDYLCFGWYLYVSMMGYPLT